MIDAHTHLAAPEFDNDREAVIARARAVGVERILVVGEDAATNRRVLAVCASSPLLVPCLGLHPDRWADGREPPAPDEIEDVVLQVRTHAAVLAAIGEVGLDRRVTGDPERWAAQAEAFRRMVRLAMELDLPLNVHARSAGHHAIDLLVAEGARRVLMHAFDGRAHHAARGAAAGFLFSVPPSVVRSVQKVKLVQRLPLEALALETDSPVLGPRPDARNEPANLIVSASEIARIKQLPEASVRAVTTGNARRLFRLAAPV
jgi:TatD DNase family protein